MSVFSDSNLPPPENRILQDLWQAPDQSAFETLLKNLDIDVVLERISTNPEHLSTPQLEELESRLMKYSAHPENTSLKERVAATFEKILGPLPDHALIQEVRGKFSGNSEREVNLIARAIQGVESAKQRTEIFDVIGLMPSEEREGIIALALPRIKGLKDGTDRAFILTGIEEIPKADRKSALDAIVSLFTSSVSGTMESRYMNNHRILTYFRVIPKDKRAEFLNKIGFFLAELPTASKGSLLNHIKEIPLADLEDAIHRIGGLIKVIKDGGQIGQILAAVAKIPPGDREDVVKKVVSLINVGETSQHIASVVHAIAKIPPDERAEVIGLVKPKIQGSDDNIQIAYILRGVFGIPPKDRASITDTIVDLFSGNDISDNLDIGLAILDIPKDKRAEFLNKIGSLLAEFPITRSKAKLLSLIKEIPVADLEDAIHRIGTQIKVIKDGEEIGAILVEVAKIPPGDREDVVKKVVSLIKVGEASQHIATVVSIIANIPPGERDAVIGLVKPKIQGVDDNLQISCLLGGIGAIPSKDRASMTDTIVDLFSGNNISDKFEILLAIDAIPEKERVDRITKAVPLIKAVGEKKAWIFKMVPFFSPGNLDDLTKFLSENRSKIKKDWPQNIQWVFEENPALAEQTRSYLLTQLQSLMDPKEVRSLAQVIYNQPQVFQIHEEHELFQEAISKLALTENTNDPKNPYRLFMLHKQRASEPLPSVNPSSEVIDGKSFSLNPQGFQENAILATPITFAQLPKNVGPDDVRKLFAALEARLEHMEPQEREAAGQCIQGATESSFQSLQTNFADDAYLNSLLAIPRGKPEETVPADAARFFAIVSFISSQSNIVNPGQLLSPQEEVLLKMSASIQACKKGKSEGVALAYNTLEPSFRYDKVQAGGENAKTYLAKVVQEELSNALSADNPMMRELTGSSGSISQLAHETIYLKNFIGRAIGLPHPLEFDPYTGVISIDLKRDLKDTLEIFYKHMTPKALAAALKKQVDRELYKNKTAANPAGTFDKEFFGKLNAFLGNALGNWDMDEDEMEVEGLSEKGAFNLLVKAGYLKQA